MQGLQLDDKPPFADGNQINWTSRKYNREPLLQSRPQAAV